MSEDKQSKLAILAFGAGAIGAYLGGSLARQGHSLTFLERKRNAPALKQTGLHLQLGDKNHRVKEIQVFTSIKAAIKQGPFDVALFALKSYDTAAALEDIAPHATEMPPVLCLQNGVDNEPALTAVLGAEKVIAGTVTTAVGKTGPGQIALQRQRGVGLASHHPLSRELQRAFEQAGLNPQLYANPAEMKWSKLLTNLLTNASCAILDRTPTQVFEDKSLFRLEMLQLREALAVMEALALGVVDLPGTPVRALAFAARGLNFALARPLMKRAVGRGRGDKMPSLHIDLHSGKGRSEVAWLNGAVVRYGEQVGVATPVNRVLAETLQAMVAAPSAQSLEPDQLLARLPGWAG